MNKHELMLAMPTITVKYEEIERALEKESESLIMAKRFVQSMSLNRYLEGNLIDLDYEKIVNLFEYLKEKGFFVGVNHFGFYGSDNEVKKLATDFDYGISYKFISDLIKEHKNITDKVITIDEEDMTYAEIFSCDLVVSRNDMQLGDMPTIMTMLTAQKALFALLCTTENIQKLTEAKGNVEIIQTLPTLL